MNRRPILLSLLLVAAAPPQTRAASPGIAADSQAVMKVLKSETQPNVASVDRRNVLAAAASATDNRNAAMWQSGFVKLPDGWHDAIKPLDESDSVLMDDYRALRGTTPGTVEGHLKLANWCQVHKLPEQERAHLAQVLVLAPPTFDRSPIYQRMGYRNVGNQWASPTQLEELKAKSQKHEVHLRAWRPKVERIVRNWTVDGKQHKQAQEQLQEIVDPTAIPAMLAASTVNESLAAAICKQLGSIASFEASQALATIAVQSPWMSVRQEAAKQLKGRRIDDFAPILLAEMRSPFSNAKSGESGEKPIVYVREEADRYHAVDLRLIPTIATDIETVIHPKAGNFETRRYLNKSPARNTTDDVRRFSDAVIELTQRIEQENDSAEEYNRRATKVLAEVTGLEPCPDPRHWWGWWNVYTGTQPLSKKCQVDRMVTLPQRPSYRVVVGCSCLVAGTTICTNRGQVPVEQIQVGDLVLAKNITTGEIDYKSVEQTTVRDPVPVRRFVVAREPIIASEGHHFWISGTGWCKVRDLKDGLPIHTVTGMSRIETATDEPEPAAVYNLVVADFHTYFVGPSMVLSHDVTYPAPTNIMVPGLEAN